ncbi:MAG TPA: orotidine-5'-phosphate decarboxylase [Candidatus Micrarchaeaceae archaeon]|nr:orotidine-5'-phosphate decarboxylase [Candidatus Micrarchaeaceae archaeon]
MTRAPFRERLEAAVATNGAALCIGIDPDATKIPAELGQGIAAVRQHTLAILEATAPYAAAFKPNFAFFERLGAAGFELLIEVVREARRHALVIADAKRGDIGSTAAAYAEAIFEVIGADACTVNGYLGHDSLLPFLDQADRFAFIVCRTSNPGAADFQDLSVGTVGEPLFLHLARRAVEWNARGTVGLVAGATWPAEITKIRAIAPNLPLLLPGVGTQGADLAQAVAAAGGGDASGRYLVSSSRAISQASTGTDFAEAAARAARALRDQMRDLTHQAVQPD